MDSRDPESAATHSAPASIGHLLEAQARHRPDAVAIVAPGRSPLTYRRLHEQVSEVVDRLKGLGLVRNDRVAVTLPNGPEMAAAFLGVAAAVTCAPLNPTYTSAEFDFYLSDLAARALIVASGSDSPARVVAKTRGIAVIELSPRRGAEAGVFDLDGQAGPPPSHGGLAEARDVALVLHTSGTTSRPKIIPLSHTNLCSSAHNIRSSLRLVEDDRCLNVMPLFHIHGLIGALLASLAAGASVVCTPGLSPVHFFQWIEEFFPTWYTAVPSMHHEVLARAAANRNTIARCRLRVIRSSSAPLPPRVMADLERTFDAPVIEAYGMTEASHQIASNPLPPGQRKAGSVGRPVGTEVAIIDEAGRPLPRGETGEIAIRGTNVTSFAPASLGSESALGDGWFHTGDTGFLDGDGYLFISGRLKEIINRGGEKISPREVDEVLQEHPGVAQAVACAIPDPRLGEDVIAAVVRRPGASVSERELRQFASTRLAPFKVPRRVMFVEQIPKGPTGKIQRIGLADRLGVQSLKFTQPAEPATFVAPRTRTEATLAEIWVDILGLDRVGVHDNFFELGGDSLASVEVDLQVQARLGVTVNARELAFGTLQQVATACEERTQRDGSPKRAGWVRIILGRLGGQK
jgi:acyl-CoA synthetase (AMP-forming)/AMP-acid ligase II/acyl carrier protein